MSNTALTSLEGLESITSLDRSFGASGNPLVDLRGLDGLTTVGGDLYVTYTDGFTDLSGLDSLTSVGGILGLSGLHDLTSLHGLEALETAGGVVIGDTSLDGLDALSGVTTVGSVGVWLWSNPALTDVDGLARLGSPPWAARSPLPAATRSRISTGSRT
jgi:hypothetical protein